MLEILLHEACFAQHLEQALGDAHAVHGRGSFHPAGLYHRQADYVPLARAFGPEIADAHFPERGAYAYAHLEQRVDAGDQRQVFPQVAYYRKRLADGAAGCGIRVYRYEILVGPVEQPAGLLDLDAGKEQKARDERVGFLRPQILGKRIDDASEMEHQRIA